MSELPIAGAGVGLRPDPLPRHVAIIMDGNRRWARQRLLPSAFGHRQGVQAVRATVRAARELGIPCLTLYSFSSENWNRPPDEVDGLMWLLRRYLREDLAELHRQGVRLRVIGSRERVPEDIVALIAESEALTDANTAQTLVIAFNYGGKAEIVAAARAIAADVAAGRLSPEAVSDEVVAARLATAGLPDPDLVIRTSGEKRLSNFLIWQSAYAELVFVDAYWPDFSKDDLVKAIAEYQRRDRRYGGR